MFASLAAFSILSIRNGPQHQKLILFSVGTGASGVVPLRPRWAPVPDPICGVAVELQAEIFHEPRRD
jgi:hypothetical protein